MIQAIKELGELKLKGEGRDTSDLLSILVQDPNLTKRYPFTFVIVFEKKDTILSYSKILPERTSKDKIIKYLYRRKSSQGSNYTPTCLTGKSIETTLKNRIDGWFSNIKETKEGKLIFELKAKEEKSQIPIESPLFRELLKVFKTYRNKIFFELVQQWKNICPSLEKGKGTGVVLTIGFTESDGSMKYIGEYKEFQQFLIDLKLSKLKEVRKKDHFCSFCGRKKEVYGNALADIFKFYNLDKPGYIPGGFQRLDAWKNNPICFECALNIEEGKDFLDNYLQFSMARNKYYLIPKLILETKEAKKVIEDMFTTATQPVDVLAKKSLRRITNDEKEVLEELGKFKDLLTYNFMFFERQTGSSVVHRINLLVEDVLPSRISTIFNAKIKAEAPEIFKNLKVKKNKYEDVEFRFDAFRQFTPSRKTFLEVVDKAFRGRILDQNLLISWCMRNIRQGFVNKAYLKPSVLQAFVSFLFFKELGILPKNEYFREGGELMSELKEKAERFFGDFSESFIAPVHKTVFLLGALTQKLLNIQRSDREATPFRKNLKGLKMKEADFKGLLPKIQNKLEEYGKNYYRSLESLISEYFLQAGKNWNFSTDELNFYFVLGMNLVDEVYKALGLTKEKEEV